MGLMEGREIRGSEGAEGSVGVELRQAEQRKEYTQVKRGKRSKEDTQTKQKEQYTQTAQTAQSAQSTQTKQDQIDEVQESLVMDVCDFYGRPYDENEVKRGKGRDDSLPSLRATAEEFDISVIKVRKILITGGLFQTELSDEIQKMYVSGMTVKQIAAAKSMSAGNVSSYLPYERVIYNLEVKTDNAERIMKWRNDQGRRIIGRPSVSMKQMFNAAKAGVEACYAQDLSNVMFFSCSTSDGGLVIFHILGNYGFKRDLPKNMTVEEYLSNTVGHIFMDGIDGDGNKTDAILMREDTGLNDDELKRIMINLLCQIVCHRAEGNLQEEISWMGENNTSEIIRSKAARHGYEVWSSFISEYMTRLVNRQETEQETGQGSKQPCDENNSSFIEDGSTFLEIIKDGEDSDTNMGWLLCECADGVECQGSKEFQKTVDFVHKKIESVAAEYVYQITLDFILKLGRIYLAEKYSLLTRFLEG